MQRLELSDNERAILITALRRLVDFDPHPLSPQNPGVEGHRTAGSAETAIHTRHCEHRVKGIGSCARPDESK